MFEKVYRIWLWFWSWIPPVADFLYIDLMAEFEEWFNTVANTIVQSLINFTGIDINFPEIALDIPYEMILIEWLTGSSIWWIMAIGVFGFCFKLVFEIIKAVIDILL